LESFFFFGVGRNPNLFTYNLEQICRRHTLSVASRLFSHSNFSHLKKAKLVKIVAIWFPHGGGELTVVPGPRSPQLDLALL
jgi:hypothetical protein